ncbi:MAG: hypothetical protein KC656_05940, partial [Myxococcales bacterium]|nr:hypothetical protein [Myxococcales bacterium]
MALACLAGCSGSTTFPYYPCGPGDAVEAATSPFGEPPEATLRRALDFDVEITWHRDDNPFTTTWRHVTDAEMAIFH